MLGLLAGPFPPESRPRSYKSALDQTLKDAGITEIYAAGIATTHCVRWTVEDAANLLGYKANIIIDAPRRFSVGQTVAARNECQEALWCP